MMNSSSQAEPVSSNGQLDDGYSESIIVANIAVLVLAIISAALRVVARRYMKLSLWWDDYLVFAALPFAIALSVMTSIAAKHGLGKHINAVSKGSLPTVMQSLVSSQLLWATSLPLIKISVLLFYIRIFGHVRFFRVMAWILGTFDVCWAVMVVFACAFQCVPLAHLWNPEITAQCINSGLFLTIGSAPDFVTDIIITVLPMRTVWILNATLAQRAMLTVVFMLGSFTCIVSIVRFSILCVNGFGDDFTYDLGSLGAWSVVETCIAIVAACLPTIWPLLATIIPGVHRPQRPGAVDRNNTALFSRSNRTKRSGSVSNQRFELGIFGYEDLESSTGSVGRGVVRNEITADGNPDWNRTIPTNVIMVETTRVVQ